MRSVLFSLIALGAIGAALTPDKDQFTDITARSGVHFLHRASPTAKKYLPETMGSGVALFDYDNDGLLDIYFVNGARIDDPTPAGSVPAKDGPQYSNRLYHQKRAGTFEDVTESAGLAGRGYGMGVAAADYDNDGYDDLFVTSYGRNTLYHNNGNGTFTDVTGDAGVAGSGWSTSAAWVDYDRDGKLDLIVNRYLAWDFADIYCGEHRDGFRAYCHPNLFKPVTQLLYHNEDGRRFREVSHQAGLTRAGKGLGVAIADYDRDGWPDIVIANDSMQQFLLHNKHNGTFEEVALESQTALDSDGGSFAGMGVDFADYNNDGWPDIVVSDLANEKYALFTNAKDGTFAYSSYATGLAGLTVLHSGWGIRFFDFDNDGWKDLMIAQGHVLDTIETTTPSLRYKEPPMLLRNTGKGFIQASQQLGASAAQNWAARGLAIGDIDNDGRIDAVVTTTNGPAYLLRNEIAAPGHWLMLNLAGRKSNRDGIGAEVKLVTAAGPQWAMATTGGSYCSSSDRRIHFGLGQEKTATAIEIKWPSGINQTLLNIKADQILTVTEPER